MKKKLELMFLRVVYKMQLMEVQEKLKVMYERNLKN